MKKIDLSIQIDATPEKVWQTVIGEKTYPIWTEAFGAGSDFQGKWEQGGKVLFAGPGEDGGLEGMVSEIAELRPNEYLSIRHLGYLRNGVEDTTSPEIKAWAPSYENYTLTAKDGGTEFTLDMDSQDEFYDMFMMLWPKALERIKELAETDTCKKITIATWVKGSLDKVWDAFTKPEHITKWCFASEDWEAPHAENDLRTGGTFSTRMQAKDGSFGFDFGGTYTNVKEKEVFEYEMSDGRTVMVTFMPGKSSVLVTEIFDMEMENAREMQQQGWQSILANFKKYVEALA